MTFNEVARIGRRTVRVNLDAVAMEMPLVQVGRFAETMDVLRSKGYIIKYVYSHSPTGKSKRKYLGRKTKSPRKSGPRALILLTESELRDEILKGHKDGKLSREIYEELRAQDLGFKKQAYVAHWKYIHNGTYHKRGLI